MLRHILFGVLLSGVAASAVATQVPPACTCTQTANFPTAIDPDIGRATTTATCQVIFPTPGTSACQVSGTITFWYCPSPSFGWGFGQWGIPPTNISRPSGSYCYPNPGITYTHPSTGTTVTCGQGGVSSYLFVTGTLTSGGTASINPRLAWSCDAI